MPAGVSPAERHRLLSELIARRHAGETFKAICATPGWPSRPTLRKWLRRGTTRRAAALPTLRARTVCWSPAVSDEFCGWIALGRSMRDVCGERGMPDRKTVDTWRRRFPVFAADLRAARAEGGRARNGRHSTWCPVLADDIFMALCEGQTLKAICAQPGYPAPRTVRDWAEARPDFARTLNLAREIAWENHREQFGVDLATVQGWWEEATGETPRLFR